MLHDIPEIPGEISTFCQRLPKEGKVTETKRQELEHKLAEALIFHALKASYEGEDSLEPSIDQAISQSQIDVQKESESAEARYKRVEQCYQKIRTDLKFEPDSEFEHDYRQLLDSYYMAEQACEFDGEKGVIG